MTEPGVFWSVSVTSECGREIDQIVADETYAILLDNRIESIRCFRIGIIKPRRKHIQRTEIATVFVGNDIIRIIRTSTLIRK